MRYQVHLVVLVVMASIPSQLKAESSPLSLELRSGFDSNVFVDTSHRQDVFLEMGISLRGTIDLSETRLAYGASHTSRHYRSIELARKETSAAAIGITHQFNDWLGLALEAAYGREDSGDLLFRFAGRDFGYRSVEHRLDIGAEAEVRSGLGITSLLAKASRTIHSVARFNIDGVTPFRLDANVSELTGELRHTIHISENLRMVAGGLYNKTYISRDDRLTYFRFPAERLRGHIGLGADLTDTISARAEFGGNHLKSASEPPLSFQDYYISASLSWRMAENLRLSLAYLRDISLRDVDDAVGEAFEDISLDLTLGLMEGLEANAGYSLRRSRQIYYEYSTRRHLLHAGLSWQAQKHLRGHISLARTIHMEDEPEFDYRRNEFSMGLTASF